MGSIGRPLVPVLPDGRLGDLQRRVLDSVARSLDRAAGGDRPRVDVAPEQTACVADGLRVLLAALPGVTGTAPDLVPVDTADTVDTATLLVRTADVLDRVAEASRRASVAFAVVGHEVAADIADSLMTVALALRTLVEIALRS